MIILLRNMKNVRKINLVYSSAFFGDALFSPFIALYLISIGFSDYERGILLAVIPICTIIGNFIYGKLSSSLKRNFFLLKILSLVNSLVIILFGLTKDFYLLLILTILFGLHNSSYFSIQDGVGVTICEEEKKIYSRTRMFGSLGYCIALLSGSYLVSLLDYRYIFIIAGTFFFLINVIALFIKLPVQEKIIEKEDIKYKDLFKNKTFVLYSLFYLLVNGIWVIGEAYTSTYFNYLEVKDSTYSLMYGIQVGIEIVVIFICSLLIKKKFNIKLLLLISCIAISLRYLLLGTNLSPLTLMIITSLLRGIGWGGFLSSHLLLVKKVLGISLTTKGITFLAIITNLLGSIGNFFAPYIYLNISFRWLYLIFGFIQIIGTIILSRINFELIKEEK